MRLVDEVVERATTASWAMYTEARTALLSYIARVERERDEAKQAAKLWREEWNLAVLEKNAKLCTKCPRSPELDSPRADLARVERERDAAFAALGAYGRHDDDCQLQKEWHRHKGCDCGLDSVIAKAKNMLESQEVPTKGRMIWNYEKQEMMDLKDFEDNEEALKSD